MRQNGRPSTVKRFPRARARRGEQIVEGLPQNLHLNLREHGARRRAGAGGKCRERAGVAVVVRHPPFLSSTSQSAVRPAVASVRLVHVHVWGGRGDKSKWAGIEMRRGAKRGKDERGNVVGPRTELSDERGAQSRAADIIDFASTLSDSLTIAVRSLERRKMERLAVE